MQKANSLPQDRDSNPWRYCVVCSRHHDQGRKHIFTTKHKNKLNTILNKFSEKVRSARQRVQKPGVMEGELEPDSTLWCYFCQLEVTRHVTDHFTTMVWGGLLEHMASPSHHKSTRRFWWLNGADKKLLQNFLLFEAEYRRYKELVAVTLEQLETRRELKQKEEVRQLQAKEESQALAAREPPASRSPVRIRYVTVRNKHGIVQNPTGVHEGRRVWGGGIVKYKPGSDQLLAWSIDRHHTISRSGRDGPSSSSLAGRKVTVAAVGDMSLTAIQPHKRCRVCVPRGPPSFQSLSVGRGNVHSGATPPWLMPDSSGDGGRGTSVLVGPSEEEFLKHKEQGKRKGRKGVVGADFHLKLASSSHQEHEWFPSFGRVWNTGPRFHSLADFKRERSSGQIGPSLAPWDRPGPSGLHQTTSATTTTPAVSRTLLPGVAPEDVRPYVRKRKKKAEHQDNG